MSIKIKNTGSTAIKWILFFQLVLLLLCPLTLVAAQHDLILSLSSNRINPVPLQGESVTGNMYVFASPVTGISRVSFYLDDPQMAGSPIQVENLAPYDLAGTNLNGSAKPYDTTRLADGVHRITAMIALGGGGIGDAGGRGRELRSCVDAPREAG